MKLWLLLACWVVSSQSLAELRTPARPLPRIAIIIDDLGHNLSRDRRVLSLPTSVAVAVLPGTPHGQQLARQATRIGHEVLLHMPMESREVRSPESIHLSATMDQVKFGSVLNQALDQIPQAVGVNNHQGSWLTSQAEPMRWLMEVISQRGGLYFVDSRTSADSVALREARKLQVPALGRHVFLDHRRDREAIVDALNTLVERAKQHGSAVAIGHPHPETIETLEWALPQVAAQGVRLVPPSKLLD